MDHPFFALALSLRPTGSSGGVPEGDMESLPTATKDKLRAFQRLQGHIPPPETDEELPCPKCLPSNKRFKSELALRMHLASEFHRCSGDGRGEEGSSDSAETKSWTCPRCPSDKVFNSGLALRMHIASRSHERDSSEAGPGPGPKKPKSQRYRGNTGSPKRNENFVGPPRIMPEAPSVVPTPDSRISESIKTITLAITDTNRITFSDQMLRTLNTHLRETQVIVLSSTRDMAFYVDTVLAARCEPFGITCYACVDGSIIRKDMRSLAEGPHIVSGTPGRVGNMIRRGSLRVEGVKILVLNKEEELLSRTIQGGVAEVYCLLRPDTKIARASVKVAGMLAGVGRRAVG